MRGHPQQPDRPGARDGGQAERAGAPVSWEQVTAIAGDGVVGRPHVARALADSGVVASPADAFSPDWIGTGGRAHVPGTRWTRSGRSRWSAGRAG